MCNLQVALRKMRVGLTRTVCCFESMCLYVLCRANNASAILDDDVSSFSRALQHALIVPRKKEAPGVGAEASVSAPSWSGQTYPDVLEVSATNKQAAKNVGFRLVTTRWQTSRSQLLSLAPVFLRSSLLDRRLSTKNLAPRQAGQSWHAASSAPHRGSAHVRCSCRRTLERASRSPRASTPQFRSDAGRAESQAPRPSPAP